MAKAFKTRKKCGTCGKRIWVSDGVAGCPDSSKCVLFINGKRSTT